MFWLFALLVLVGAVSAHLVHVAYPLLPPPPRVLVLWVLANVLSLSGLVGMYQALPEARPCEAVS